MTDCMCIMVGNHMHSQTSLVSSLGSAGVPIRELVRTFSNIHGANMEFMLTEVQKQENIRHPYLVPFSISKVSDGTVVLSRKYVDGVSLSEFIYTNGPQPRSFCLCLALKIAKALQYLHSMGIAAMSLRPENIIIDQATDDCKIVDFGIAQIFEDTASLCDGPEAIAFQGPEGIHYPNEIPTKELDIFHLGLILFTALMGRLPWTVRNLTRIVQQMRSDTISIPEEVDVDYQEILKRMWQSDPNMRPASSEVFLELERMKNRPDQPVDKKIGGRTVTGSKSLKNIGSFLLSSAGGMMIDGLKRNIERSESTDVSKSFRNCPIVRSRPPKIGTQTTDNIRRNSVPAFNSSLQLMTSDSKLL